MTTATFTASNFTARIRSLLGMFLVAAMLLAPKLVAAQGLSFNLTNHLGATSFRQLLVDILNIFIIIATPIVVLFIIYAGFLYVTARGNAQQVEQATRALTYSVIGAILIIGSVAISQIVANVAGSFTTTTV